MTVESNVADVFTRALTAKRIVIDDIGALNTKTNRYIGYTRKNKGPAQRISWYDQTTKKRWKISLSTLTILDKDLAQKSI